MSIGWVWLSSQWNGLSAYGYVWWEARLMVPLDGNGCPGWIIHRIWARWTEFGVAGVGKWMGGWARIGTKVWRWMVIGIKGLWAQSDRMLSIGDGQTHVGVPQVCPKKEKMCMEWLGGWTGCV